jgi:hypothetical protein
MATISVNTHGTTSLLEANKTAENLYVPTDTGKGLAEVNGRLSKDNLDAGALPLRPEVLKRGA